MDKGKLREQTEQQKQQEALRRLSEISVMHDRPEGRGELYDPRQQREEQERMTRALALSQVEKQHPEESSHEVLRKLPGIVASLIVAGVLSYGLYGITLAFMSQ